MNVVKNLPRVCFTVCWGVVFVGCGLQQDRADFSDSKVELRVAETDAPAERERVLEANDQSPPVTDSSRERGPSVELQQRALAATVRVVLPEADGSGVILGRTGDQLHVLTVAHAVQEGVSAVELFDPEESLDEPVARLPAVQIVDREDQLDLAVLRVRVSPSLLTSCLPLHSSDGESIEAGQVAYSVGCSHGQAPRIVTETLRGQNVYTILNDGKAVRRTMWSTNEPQESGRSGGPLISANGTLIGIALGKTVRKDRSLGFYCHFDEIRDYLIDTDLRSLVKYKALDKFDK